MPRETDKGQPPTPAASEARGAEEELPGLPAGATNIRLGSDPFDRGELTVYYRHPTAGCCYVWLRLLPEATQDALARRLQGGR